MAALASEKILEPTPPPTQFMDDSPSRRACDVEAEPPAADAPDRTFIDRSSAFPSPSRQFDLQNQLAFRSEEYRQLFRLPQDEVLVQDFNCALQDNFLLQGHMYLFAHHICFYSNLLGFETKKIIPFHEVTSVRRAKAAVIFPTAIEIIAGGKKYFFTSFLSRDEAFKLINDGWLQHSDEAKAIADQQELKSELNGQDYGGSVIEKANSPNLLVDELDLSQREEVSISKDTEIPANGEPEIVSTTAELHGLVDEDTEIVQNIDSPLSQNSSVLEQENADAPNIPGSYTMVAESKFLITVVEFFNLFFSDEAVGFQESFHKKCGDKEFKCSKWHSHETLGQTREVSFQHPIKIYFGARFGSCQELQKYRLYRNCHLVVNTSQEINDVPYGDYFRVEGLWDVQREIDGSKEGCILRVYIDVAFSKKTMWKGKIVQSTVEECREAYATWIDLAHELLKKKHLEGQEGVGGHAPNLIPNGQVIERQLSGMAECSNNLDPSRDLTVSQALPDSKDMNEQVDSLQEGYSGAASAASMFRNSLITFFSSAKYQNQVLVVILLLMQISLLVLLSRPQIHVIPQADCVAGLWSGERAAETVTFLDNQIKHLREEALIVERLLEKMRYEHELLQVKIKDLEVLRKRQKW